MSIKDENGVNMWLFAEKIASIRDKVRFDMRISTHDVARLCNVQGYTALTNTPLVLPLPPTQPAVIDFEYTTRGSERKESIPVSRLVRREAHTGCPHVAIRGEHMGLIVDISSLAGENTRVVRFGESKRKKSNILVIRSADLAPVQVHSSP